MFHLPNKFIHYANPTKNGKRISPCTWLRMWFPNATKRTFPCSYWCEMDGLIYIFLGHNILDSTITFKCPGRLSPSVLTTLPSEHPFVAICRLVNTIYIIWLSDLFFTLYGHVFSCTKSDWFVYFWTIFPLTYLDQVHSSYSHKKDAYMNKIMILITAKNLTFLIIFLIFIIYLKSIFILMLYNYIYIF